MGAGRGRRSDQRRTNEVAESNRCAGSRTSKRETRRRARFSFFFFFFFCRHFPRPPSRKLSPPKYQRRTDVVVDAIVGGDGNGRQNRVKTPFCPDDLSRHFSTPFSWRIEPLGFFAVSHLLSPFSRRYFGVFLARDRRSHGNSTLLLAACTKGICSHVVRTGYEVRSEVVRSSLSSLLRSEGIYRRFPEWVGRLALSLLRLCEYLS